jgi:uncharacterized metal-binding protein YceD (DUF177 family)
VKEYRIQFSGLAEGEHAFRFVLEKPFFEHFEDEAIGDGRVEVEVLMDRQQRMLVFSFLIKGEVEVVCDLCTDPLRVNIAGDERLIARISSSGGEDTADIVFIPEEAFEFDLTPHLYDYARLLLPMRLTHEGSADGRECDPEMLKLLERYRKEKSVTPGMEGLAGLIRDDEEETEIQ